MGVEGPPQEGLVREAKDEEVARRRAVVEGGGDGGELPGGHAVGGV